MKLKLKIWRQKNSNEKGKIVSYDIENISPDMSFLEMMDVLNEQLISEGTEPIAFDHDCREGCLLYTSPSPRDRQKSRMPSSA